MGLIKLINFAETLRLYNEHKLDIPGDTNHIDKETHQSHYRDQYIAALQDAAQHQTESPQIQYVFHQLPPVRKEPVLERPHQQYIEVPSGHGATESTGVPKVPYYNFYVPYQVQPKEVAATEHELLPTPLPHRYQTEEPEYQLVAGSIPGFSIQSLENVKLPNPHATLAGKGQLKGPLKATPVKNEKHHPKTPSTTRNPQSLMHYKKVMRNVLKLDRLKNRLKRGLVYNDYIDEEEDEDEEENENDEFYHLTLLSQEDKWVAGVSFFF